MPGVHHLPGTVLQLQVYPKLYLGGGSMYDTSGWKLLVTVWELTVWNSIVPPISAPHGHLCLDPLAALDTNHAPSVIHATSKKDTNACIW